MLYDRIRALLGKIGSLLFSWRTLVVFLILGVTVLLGPVSSTTERGLGAVLSDQSHTSPEVSTVPLPTVIAETRSPAGASVEIEPEPVGSIERTIPVNLDVGGLKRAMWTSAETVGELLETEGIVLGPRDLVQPELNTPIAPDLQITITRVQDEYYIEEVPVPVETHWEPEPKMEIDQYKVIQWGREGAKRRRIRVHYENGREVSRTQEEEWIAKEPLSRLFTYGTKIVLRRFDTPDGPVTYWRKLRMLATSYNAPTAGVSPDHPWYGLTKLGWKAREGIIAVDPRVINLRQEMYVPGYGPGVAGDTGGAIKWRRIDLCYDDDNLILWHRWVDVYLLAPAPPSDDINWIIPNYPNETE